LKTNVELRKKRTERSVVLRKIRRRKKVRAGG